MSSRYSPLPLVLAFLAGSFVIACDGDGPSDVAVPDRIEITAAADTLTALGDQTQLTARAFDADGNEILGLEFDWSCVNCGVASVVPTTGSVTAVSNGSATVRATIPGMDVTGEIGIHVSQRATTVTVSPASPTLNTVGATQTFTASALDANDNPIEDFVALWISGDHRVATVSPSGVATSTGSGAATITAAVHGIPGSTTLTVDQQAAQLAFRTDPSGAQAGASISPAIQVEIQDASGNRVADAEALVTLAIASGPGTLAGTQTVGAVNGVATFSGMWLDKVGDYTLTATATGAVTATSPAFAISAGAPARLSFTTQPTNADGNEPMTVQVNITDDWGNSVPTATNTVNIRFGENPGAAELLGTTSVAAAGGVATFTVRIDRPAQAYTLQARSEGLDPALSADFAVELNFTKLADGAGAVHTCGLTVGGHAYCWGYNFTGQLGNGTTVNSAVPVLVGGGHAFTDISVGFYHSCAVTEDEEAYCWGDNFYGQLGNSTNTNSTQPVQVAAAINFRSIATGSRFTCAVDTANKAWCWGLNSSGQLGTGNTTAVSVPVAVSGTHQFASMTAGSVHTCGLTTGAFVYCWGNDANGQVGNDGAASANLTTPTIVAGAGLTFKSVSAGELHTCATTTEGGIDRARCWGRNANGELGDGTFNVAYIPTLTDVDNPGDDNYIEIDGGRYFTCAVLPDNTSYCWGANGDGQLGIGEATGSQNSRVEIPGFRFTSLATGYRQTCGIAVDGDVYCWGNGTLGELGSGQFVSSNVPIRILQ